MIKKNGNNEIKTLSHSTYRCQYHIVFAPKYRRKAIYGKIKKDIGEIIRKLCEQKGVEITSLNKYPTIHKCSTIHGISQGKKHTDDFRPTREFKV